MISNLNSVHNLNSPLLCNNIFTGPRDWNVNIFGRGREGGYIIQATQLFVIHWVLEFKSNFFTPLIPTLFIQKIFYYLFQISSVKMV